MGAIPTTEARSLYTNALVAVLKERNKPKSFLRSFFKVEEKGTKYLSIEVQRGTERLASDVLRGTEGNRNTFSRSTQKIFEPPYFREFFDATSLDIYDRMFTANGVVTEEMVADYVSQLAEKLSMLQDKIERAYEKQAADVFETGIITLVTGNEQIDYKRKAGSLVDKGAGNYWTTGSVDVFADLKNAGKFLRETGKSDGMVLNAICGDEALAALMSNTTFLDRQNLFNMSLDAIAPPIRNSSGGTAHGRLSAGTFIVNIWSYNDIYETSNGTKTPYLNPKNVIVLPNTDTAFVHGFAAVPQLLDGGGAQNVKGAYKFGEFVDKRKKTHEYDVESAGLMIPVSVDQIYTLKVVA